MAPRMDNESHDEESVVQFGLYFPALANTPLVDLEWSMNTLTF